MKWWSESRGMWLELADMHGKQIANGRKKLLRGEYVPDGEPLSVDEETTLAAEMLAELERRGLNIDGGEVAPPPADDEAPREADL